MVKDDVTEMIDLKMYDMCCNAFHDPNRAALPVLLQCLGKPCVCLTIDQLDDSHNTSYFTSAFTTSSS